MPIMIPAILVVAGLIALVRRLFKARKRHSGWTDFL
jgi:hypothetical protein